MGNIRKGAGAALLLTMILLPIAGGAWAQGAPAQIDRSTPAAQDGIRLLAVTRGDAQGSYTLPVPPGPRVMSAPRENGYIGGIGLWIRGVKPPVPMQGQARGYYDMSSSQPPQVYAAAANGDNVSVMVQDASFLFNPRGAQVAPLFLVSLAGGYPAGYPAIDVQLIQQGHSARWRLIRLAGAYHAIVPPVAIHSAFTGAGVKLNVHAWRSPGYILGRNGVHFNDLGNEGVQYAVTAQVPTGSHWVVRIFKQQLEWDPVHPGEMEGFNGQRFAAQYAHQTFWTAGFGQPARYAAPATIPTPYGKYNHFLRLTGELVQMASITENVTFHNLTIRKSAVQNQFRQFPNNYSPPPSFEIAAKPQTVVTPSGISISLLPMSVQGQQKYQFGGYGQPNSIRMLMRFKPIPSEGYPDQQNYVTLANSPLWKKYRKFSAYFLMAPKPYFLTPPYAGFMSQQGSDRIQEVETLLLYKPMGRSAQTGQMDYQPVTTIVPRHLDSLTFTVTQRAELKTLPISFLVPIGSQPADPRTFFH